LDRAVKIFREYGYSEPAKLLIGAEMFSTPEYKRMTSERLGECDFTRVSHNLTDSESQYCHAISTMARPGCLVGQTC
jgi:hypothetical protein